MSKVNIIPIGNISSNPNSAESNINLNFEAIQSQIELLVSRDGEAPNTILEPLDLNSKRILNLGAPVLPTDAARLQDVTGEGEFTSIPAGGTTGQVLAKQSNSDFDVDWEDAEDTNIQASEVSYTGPGGITNVEQALDTALTTVADHGALTGLADDDHTQYHTDARGDARYVPLARTVTAGQGLTGGGALSSNITLDVGSGDGITSNTNDISLDASHIRNVSHSAVSITAGAGLTGGGDISATRTLDVGAGDGIAINADSVQLDTAHVRNVDHSAVSILAGTGLSGGGTIESNRTLSVDINGTATIGEAVSGGTDFLLIYNTSAGTLNKVTPDSVVTGVGGSVPDTRLVTAGAGLTGGGDLAADRTFDVGAGTGITVNSNDVALDTAHVRNTDHSAVTITAGSGLTGGGDITATRTLNVGAGSGITVNIDDVALDTSSSRNTDHGAVTLTAGNGLTGGGDITTSRSFAVGAGTGISVEADDVGLDTAHARNVDHSAVSISGTQSISGGGTIAANRTLSLVNDATTPGTDKYYGTDATGVRGYYNLPSGGGVSDHGALTGLADNDHPQYLLASSYTAADVFAKVLTQDGSGTTLDADTVDGVHASGFATSGHNHDSTYVPLTRSISAGTGLTGGGTLAADRTLSISTTVALQIGSLGVGTAASGTTGEIRATNNITAFYSSDKRLKENIKPIKGALDSLNEISGVEFDWSDKFIQDNGGEDGYFIQRHDIGVVAQEIEKQYPELVREREDGYLAVKYDRLVAVLIQAVKELKAKVEELEKK